MRLLLDLFPCQTASRLRGIGRYVHAFAEAMAHSAGNRQLYLLADGRYPESAEKLRHTFLDLLPGGRFGMYCHPGWQEIGRNKTMFHAAISAPLIHRAYQAIGPDVVLYTSPFEGWGEEGVVALPTGKLPAGPRAAIIYDFIPCLFADRYLTTPQYRDFYLSRLPVLAGFDLLLAISESTRQDAIEILGIAPERVVNISGASSGGFRKLDMTPQQTAEIKRRFGIDKPFVLCSGNDDYRKNQDGMIAAYALLPKAMRERYQLVFNQVGDAAAFNRKLREAGLSQREIVITGHVSDAELIALYNLSELCVFPSHYEGLGLPVLEAMACGVPVIAANNSSMPEIVTCGEALFDAADPNAIAAALRNTLSDDAFRQALAEYGPARAQAFTWEETSRRAWLALETAVADHQAAALQKLPPPHKPKIAFVSPLPPQKTGISTYCAELIQYLAHHFELELFVQAGCEVSDSFEAAGFAVYPHTELIARRSLYLTVVYQFGNSTFHTHMLALLREFPGVVVLHDFFLSNLAYDREFLQGYHDAFAHDIDASHGLRGLVDYRRHGQGRARRDWPINWTVLSKATALIVHSPFHFKLLERYFGYGWTPALQVVPQLRTLTPARSERVHTQRREALGLPADALVICSFGFVAHTKLNDVLLEAFARMLPSIGQRVLLVFVGEIGDDEFSRRLKRRMLDPDSAGAVKVTGFVDDATYAAYLDAADIAVQLRTESRGETSRAVLDCLAHGVPTIVNGHSTFNDYDGSAVLKVDDPPSIASVKEALLRLAKDADYRNALAQRGREWVGVRHNPEAVAAHYAAVIGASLGADERRVVEQLADALSQGPCDDALIGRIVCDAGINAALRAIPRVLIDVSRIAEHDPLTGIERVIKNLVREMFALDEPARQLELVRMADGRLVRAARFAESTLGLADGSLGEERPVGIGSGDTLLMLDSSWLLIDQFVPLFDAVRARAGQVSSVVYDLIPIRHPHTCHEAVVGAFRYWLDQAIVQSDQLLCISKSVADDVAAYVAEESIQLVRPLRLTNFGLGADIKAAAGGGSVRTPFELFMQQSDAPLFLMVGTIEPRKNHAFVLDAFDILWHDHGDARLCMTGKEGWHSDDIMRRIRTHPESGKRFYFLEQATDAELVIAYASATAVIVASLAEGFGLPIVEAAAHHVPVIASDIPVFREVGGTGTLYFSLDSARHLADAVQLMKSIPDAQRREMASRVERLTWAQSAQRLLQIVAGRKSYLHTLLPEA
jgi:glycosyltransferase involved in cell wall biosynthesis